MSAKLVSTNITHQLDLEILRCSLCKNYLSYSPIFILLPGGKNMCGRCSSVISNDSNACRNFVLETIVRNVYFPCKNKNYGCTVTFAFGLEAEHNNECIFNPQINYEILNANKCFVCRYFLMVPIFQYDGKLICNNCHYTNCKTAVPVVSDKSALLSAQFYPCRWNGCNTITQGRNISNHETSCCYRVYICPMPDCKKIFTSVLARQHFQNHSSCVLLDSTPFEMKVNVRFDQRTQSQNVVAFIHNEFVRIRYSITQKTSGGFEFSLKCETSSYDKGKVNGKINFKHEHCKAESDFVISKVGKAQLIAISDLPSCFKENEELTAVIQLY